MASRVDALRADGMVHAPGLVMSIRIAVGWVLVAMGLLVMYGIAWDSTWHGSVGRDKGFLSPPHALMYSSAAAAGLLCIATILAETWRYRTGGGVDDTNSVPIVRVFHAPVGVPVAGFGILAMVLAGPLDNYWHTLYGIFINAWQPFHMMGILGGGIWGLGNLYLWGALVLHAPRPTRAPVVWAGFLTAAMVMLRLMMTMSYPALHVFQTTQVGAMRIMTYPVILTLTTVWLLCAVRAVLRGRWMASAAVLALLAFHFVIQLTVPWLVRAQALAEGRTFFNPTLIPAFSLDRLAPDVGVLLGAAVLDVLWNQFGRGLSSRRIAAQVGAASGLAFWLVGAITTLLAAQGMARLTLPPALHLRPAATWLDALAALPLTAAAGAASAVLGRAVGEVLRRNPR